MKIRFVTFLVVALMFMTTLPAYATEITADGAAALKKEIDDALGWRLKIMQSAGEGLFTEGEVKVTPKDSYYAVALPRMYVKLIKGETLNIGVINVNAMPGKTADEWVLSAALPTPLVFTDEKSQPAITISLGKQRFSGVWLPKKDFFSAVDAAYENISIQTPKKDIEGMIGSIHTTLDLKQETDGTWSGPNNFELKNLALKTTREINAAIAIESIIGKANYGKIDLTGSQELRQKMQEMVTAQNQPTSDEMKKLIKDNASFFKGFADSISNSMTLSKLDITGQDKTGTPFTVHMGDMSFTLDVSGITREKTRAVFNTGMHDLKISAIPEEYTGLAPQSFDMEFMIDNLPLQKMIDAVTQAATSSASAIDATQKPEEVQKDVAGLMLLPVTLSNAGAKLEIKNTSLKSPALETQFSGIAKADALAVSKATADFTLSFKGIDALIQKLSDQPSSDENKNKSLMTILTPLQMMGQQETAEDGTTSRKYHFELTQEGKMLMNGTDMTAIKSMLESTIKTPAAPETIPTPVPQEAPIPN